MIRVLQIANYVIHVSLNSGIGITNLHLQKILYFLQAESLLRQGEPIFEGNMEKWRLGPVIPDVYHEYKIFGSNPITRISREMVFDPKTMKIDYITFNENDIDEEIRNHIFPLIITLLKANPYDLVDETHEHAPWLDFKDRIESGERGLSYTNDELINYFREEPDKLMKIMGGTH